MQPNEGKCIQYMVPIYRIIGESLSNYLGSSWFHFFYVQPLLEEMSKK